MAVYEQIHRITGAVHNPDQFEQVIAAIKECKYYAYIYHDFDIDEKTGNLVPRHLHFVCDDRHSLKKWSKLLGIPEHMIEIVRNFRGINRYLIHIDDPEKAQYKAEDVVTNAPLRFKSFLVDNQELSPKQLYYDLLKLRNYRMTIDDFLDKYQYFISKQSFMSQYKVMSDLINNYSNSYKGEFKFVSKERVLNER